LALHADNAIIKTIPNLTYPIRGISKKENIPRMMRTTRIVQMILKKYLVFIVYVRTQ